LKKAGVPRGAPARWRADCRQFARDVCKVEPDGWQDEFFAAASGITEPGMQPAKTRLALKACKGPGKSFAMSIVIWWWMMTRWHANCIAMSITEDNLKTNLWPELARVRQRSWALQQAFHHTAEQITAKKFEQTWFCKARSFPQNADKTQQANTIAGLHGRHPAVFCDEVGDYPEGVIVAAEAIFSSMIDGLPVEGLLAMAGNPTRTDGPLYLACMDPEHRKNWWVKEITGDPLDPSRASRIDPVWAQSEIDKWGRESDFIKVNILGKFPSQQANKLLGPEEIAVAASREVNPRMVEQDPVVMSLDVARFGDDESVLTRRQGLQAFRQMTWRETDLMTLADQVINQILLHKPVAMFVDQTGLGAGIIDRLRQLGTPNVIGVDFGGGPMDPRFADRRSEMWWLMAEWVKKGGSIPNEVTLRNELSTPLFDYKITGKTSKFILESKKEMRKRGVHSPSRADSLALTWAAPVYAPMSLMQMGDPRYFAGAYAQQRIRGGTEEDWDPYG